MKKIYTNKLFLIFLLFLIPFLNTDIQGQIKYSAKNSFIKENINTPHIHITLPVKLHKEINLTFANNTLSKHLKGTLPETKIDTVIVSSNYSNQKKYIYEYSPSNRQIQSILKIKINGKWENTTKDTIILDTNNNPIRHIWKNWANQKWENSSRNISTYGINNTLISSKNQNWQNNKWVNSDSSIYQYNQNSKAVSFYYLKWENGSWVNRFFEIYVYNSTGLLESAYQQVWKNNKWVNNIKYDYTYDTNGDVISVILSKGKDIEWENNYKETYTYNDKRKLTSYIGFNWATNAWAKSTKYDYTYNNQDFLVNATGTIYKNSKWENKEKAIFTHDTYGGVESKLVQIWKSTKWADTTLFQYSYDKKGDVIRGDVYNNQYSNWQQNLDNVLEVSYNYNTNNKYYSGFHVEASYSTQVTTDVLPIETPKISNFKCLPNPVINETVVKIGLIKNSELSLILYDFTGKKLKTLFDGKLLKGENKLSFNLGDLPKGIYFLNLRSKFDNKSIKILKLN